MRLSAACGVPAPARPSSAPAPMPAPMGRASAAAKSGRACATPAIGRWLSRPVAASAARNGLVARLRACGNPRPGRFSPPVENAPLPVVILSLP